MKKLSLFLVFMSLLVAFQIKKGDRVDVNINANGDFNVSEGNFTVEKGYINSVNSGAYIKIKPKDINGSIKEFIINYIYNKTKINRTEYNITIG